MRKELSPEKKLYRDNRDKKIIAMFAPGSVLFLGVWMLLSPSRPKHSRVEKATVSVLKDIWGFNTGLVLASIGGALLIYTIIQFIKFKKQTPKPL